VLTDSRIRATKPGSRPRSLSDGNGLLLKILPSGGRYWRFNRRFNGKQETLALGVHPDVSLAKARESRLEELLAFHEKLGPIPLVVRGDPILQLFSHIEKFDASLVALGQHSRWKSRDLRAIFGSVCRHATTSARVNTLVVPAH